MWPLLPHPQVGSFPTKVDSSRARALGLTADIDAASIVREYADDFAAAIHPDVRLQPARVSERTPNI